MISAQQIRQFQDEATARASHAKRAPLALFSVDTVEADLRRAPNLGRYRARAWRRLVDADSLTGDEARCEPIDEAITRCLTYKALSGSRTFAAHSDDVPEAEDLRLFVDKIGWGSGSEAALTPTELVDNLKRIIAASGEHVIGIGIVEEGQFQAYLGLFVKKANSRWETVIRTSDGDRIDPCGHGHLTRRTARQCRRTRARLLDPNYRAFVEDRRVEG